MSSPPLSSLFQSNRNLNRSISLNLPCCHALRFKKVSALIVLFLLCQICSIDSLLSSPVPANAIGGPSELPLPLSSSSSSPSINTPETKISKISLSPASDMNDLHPNRYSRNKNPTTLLLALSALPPLPPLSSLSLLSTMDRSSSIERSKFTIPPTSTSTSPLPNTSDAYIILNVSPEASKEEIKIAYRKAALRYHPDVRTNISSTTKEREDAHDDFAKINSAYVFLTRKRHDEDHHPCIWGGVNIKRPRSSSATSSSSSSSSSSSKVGATISRENFSAYGGTSNDARTVKKKGRSNISGNRDAYTKEAHKSRSCNTEKKPTISKNKGGYPDPINGSRKYRTGVREKIPNISGNNVGYPKEARKLEKKPNVSENTGTYVKVSQKPVVKACQPIGNGGGSSPWSWVRSSEHSGSVSGGTTNDAKAKTRINTSRKVYNPVVTSDAKAKTRINTSRKVYNPVVNNVGSSARSGEDTQTRRQTKQNARTSVNYSRLGSTNNGSSDYAQTRDSVDSTTVTGNGYQTKTKKAKTGVKYVKYTRVDGYGGTSSTWVEKKHSSEEIKVPQRRRRTTSQASSQNHKRPSNSTPSERSTNTSKPNPEDSSHEHGGTSSDNNGKYERQAYYVPKDIGTKYTRIDGHGGTSSTWVEKKHSSKEIKVPQRRKKTTSQASSQNHKRPSNSTKEIKVPQRRSKTTSQASSQNHKRPSNSTPSEQNTHISRPDPEDSSHEHSGTSSDNNGKYERQAYYLPKDIDLDPRPTYALIRSQR